MDSFYIDRLCFLFRASASTCPRLLALLYTLLNKANHWRSHHVLLRARCDRRELGRVFAFLTRELHDIVVQVPSGMVDAKDANGKNHRDRLKHPEEPFLAESISVHALCKFGDAVNTTNLLKNVVRDIYQIYKCKERIHTMIMPLEIYTAMTTLRQPAGALTTSILFARKWKRPKRIKNRPNATNWNARPPTRVRRPIFSVSPVQFSELAMPEPLPCTRNAITSNVTKIGVRRRPGIPSMRWWVRGRTLRMRRLMSR